MFQLASLLNGDSKIDEPGTVRSIPVVDYNTLDQWHFKSYGEAVNEDIPSLGKTVNRHYALMQRENDPYKRQVDIWLAKDWSDSVSRSQWAHPGIGIQTKESHCFNSNSKPSLKLICLFRDLGAVLID
jgi:hypothetical protein